MTQSGVLLPLTASGQERDKSDTHKITISNKLATRYQRRRCAGALTPHAEAVGLQIEDWNVLLRQFRRHFSVRLTERCGHPACVCARVRGRRRGSQNRAGRTFV